MFQDCTELCIKMIIKITLEQAVRGGSIYIISDLMWHIVPYDDDEMTTLTSSRVWISRCFALVMPNSIMHYAARQFKKALILNHMYQFDSWSYSLLFVYEKDCNMIPSYCFEKNPISLILLKLNPSNYIPVPTQERDVVGCLGYAVRDVEKEDPEGEQDDDPNLDLLSRRAIKDGQQEDGGHHRGEDHIHHIKCVATTHAQPERNVAETLIWAAFIEEFIPGHLWEYHKSVSGKH